MKLFYFKKKVKIKYKKLILNNEFSSNNRIK